MDAAILAIISVLSVSNIYFCFAELRRDLRVTSLRRLAAAAGIFLILLAFVLAAGARLPLRGGYDNEHDFSFMAQGFSTRFWQFTGGLQKELAPVAVKIFTDLAGGASLDAHRTRNAVLLVLDAGLITAALIRTGAAPAAAAAAGLLFLFNFLGLLNAATFSSTLANIFFFLSGVYALAALGFSGPVTWRNLAWAGCAFLLTFCSRFEFVPVLAAGLMTALVAGGADFRARLGAAWKSRPSWGVFAAACFFALAAAWAAWLVSAASYNGPAPCQLLSLKNLASNLVYHIGEQNISVFSGLGPRAAALAAVLLLLFPAAAALKRAPLGGRGLFWTAWTLLWAAYFSVIYLRLDLYPLHFMRHELYFFLPFVFAAGNAADAATGFIPKGRAVPAAFAGAALLAVYAAANLRAAYALNGQLRTNDREWQFLVKARRAWPAGCGAVYPLANVRAELLSKYFPPVLKAAGEAPCVLVYKSPSAEIFKKVPPGPAADAWPDGMFSGTFMEEKFSHAFYTVFHNGKGGGIAETLEPVPVTAGFYKLSEKSAKTALAGIARTKQVNKVLRSGLKLQEKEGISAAVAAFSAAIDGGLREAALYNARGVALLQKGDAGAAACSFELALKADRGFWQAQRSLDYIKEKYGSMPCAAKEPGR